MAGAEEQERLTPAQERRRRQAAEEARKKERALRRQRLRLLMDCDPDKQKEMQEKNPDLVPSQHEMEWVCSLRSRKLKSASFQERSSSGLAHEDDDVSDLSPTGPLTARSTASSTVSAFSRNSTVSYSSRATTASGSSTASYSSCATTASGSSTVSYSGRASTASGRSTTSITSTSSTTSGTRAAATSAATSFSVSPAHGGVRQAGGGGSGSVLRRTHSLEAANEIRMMLDGESPSRLAADVARSSPSQIVTMAPPRQQQSPARRPRVQRSISAKSANEPMMTPGDIWGRTSGGSPSHSNSPGLAYEHRRATASGDVSLGRNQTIHGFHQQPQGAGHQSSHISADTRSYSGSNYNYGSPELQRGPATARPRSGGSPLGFRRFGSMGHSPSRFAEEERCSREGQSSGRSQGRCPAPRMPPVARSSPAKRS